MSSWKFILSSKFTKYSLRTPYRRTTGDFTSALIQTTIFKSATANVFLKQTPHFLHKSSFFEGFFYIDGDGKISKNLMVHHPIPSDLKMWWPSRLFTKNWWPSVMDNCPSLMDEWPSVMDNRPSMMDHHRHVWCLYIFWRNIYIYLCIFFKQSINAFLQLKFTIQLRTHLRLNPIIQLPT